ncbi:MAG: hypothetical protein K2P80_08225 [Beijerinckiaceae bacterium]|nr:hypothetical protein [Beijerinckiaceae bacterium]
MFVAFRVVREVVRACRSSGEEPARHVRERNRLLAAIAGVVLSLCLSDAASAANRGNAAASEQQGYGRVIFNFDAAIRAKVRASNGVMVVEFSEPVDVDLEKLALQAPNYISLARRDPDGKALRFALVKSLRPDMKEAGEKLYLDLLPDEWKGQPPGLPAEVVQDLAKRAILAEENNRKAQKQRELETVRDIEVRIGTAPTFNRVIFEMPVVAPVDFKKEGDFVTLTFDGAFRIDAAAVKPTLPDSVKSFEVAPNSTSLKVTMAIPGNARVQGFREDDTFVVDIPKGNVKAAAKAPAVAPAPELKPEEKQAELASAAGEQQPDKEKPRTAKFEQPSVAKPSRLSSLGSGLDGIGAGPATDAGAGRVTYSKAGEGVRVKLAFANRPPAAVFVREDVVWMVFEGSKGLESETLPQAFKDVIGATEVDGIGGAAILRVQMARKQVVSVAPEDKGWTVTLGDETQAPTDPIVLKRGVSQDGRTALVANLADAGKVFWLDDAASGERWAVVPARGKVQGLAKAQHFVEVNAMATAQGLVFSPVADDLVVKSGLDEVWVTRDQGLSLSLGVEGAKQAGRDDRRSDLLIDTSAWRTAGKGVTRDRERDLLRSAAESPQRDRTEARLALAKFYLANKMPNDSVAVIRTLSKDDQPAGQSKPIMMMKAIGYALANDAANALKTLNDPILQLEGESVLWRAYLDGKAKRWTPALVGFRQSLDLLEKYPDPLQAEFLPLIIEAALEARDLNFAAQQLDLFERFDASERDPALIALFRGRLAEETGRVDDAMSQYALAKMTSNREIEAKARLFHAILGYNEKRVEPLKVEAELETVAVIWRRDEVELRALAKLGEIYAGSKRWREAFAAAKRAEEILPDHPITRKFEDDMGVSFETLFLNGKSDDIDKLKALALFYDFRNYTPPGRKGDEIVRRLADRLAELDLLDQAAELLQHQVDTRLGGVARASVAARLAVIYLQNRKPTDALAVLRNSRLSSVPAEMRRARALLEARALSELSRTDLAIEMVAARSGPDVERLRADIYWQGKRWREAGEAFEMVLGDAWEQQTPLSDRQRSDVMRAGIAYVLGNDRLGLDRLRTKYASLMADSVDAKSFSLVTAESGVRAKDFKELARTVVSSDTMGAFLETYRERYPETVGARSTKSLVPDKA